MRRHPIDSIVRRLAVRMQFPYLRRIVLYVNTVCNAKCPMCDIALNNNQGIARSLGDCKYFSTDLLRKVLTSPAVRGKKLNFNFLMTEPLLSPNLFELINMIKKEGHSVLITTNGYLLPEKAKMLVNMGLDKIQLSVDGPPELHDSMRGIKGLFQTIMEGIGLLNKSGKVAIWVNCTISSLNCGRLYELASILDKKVKIDRLKYQFLNFVSPQMAEIQNKNCPIKQSISSVNEKVALDKIDPHELSKQLMTVKSAQFGNIKQIRIIPNILSSEEIRKWFDGSPVPIKGNDKCSLPFYQVAIKPDGNVTWHMRCFDYMIGNINKEDLKDIFYKGEKAAYFREVLKNNSFCMPACVRCCGLTTHREISDSQKSLTHRKFS